MIKKLITLFRLGRKIAKSDILDIASKFQQPPLMIKIIFKILSFSFSSKKQNEISMSRYEAGEENRNCPNPDYLGSRYVSECGESISASKILYPCGVGMRLDGYTDKVMWDLKRCTLFCQSKCTDKSKCGSFFEKSYENTTGWFEDLWNGSNNKKKEEKKIKKKTTTTTCRTQIDGSLRCTTYE